MTGPIYLDPPDRRRSAGVALGVAALAVAGLWWWLAADANLPLERMAAPAQPHPARSAQPDAPAAGQDAAVSVPAQPADSAKETGVMPGKPPPEIDPTAVLAHVVPQPVPLARAARRHAAGAPWATPAPAAGADPSGTVVTDNGQGLISYRDRWGHTGQAELQHALVTEKDLGLAMPPGAHVDAALSTRVQDDLGALTVSAVLHSADSPERLLDFYQAQLRREAGAAGKVETSHLDEGQVLLHAVDVGTGVNHTVLISPVAGGGQITVLRSQPPRLPAGPR
jgi:hypothetical protein